MFEGPLEFMRRAWCPGLSLRIQERAPTGQFSQTARGKWKSAGVSQLQKEIVSGAARYVAEAVESGCPSLLGTVPLVWRVHHEARPIEIILNANCPIGY
jgi:hypothetical protein